MEIESTVRNNRWNSVTGITTQRAASRTNFYLQRGSFLPDHPSSVGSNPSVRTEEETFEFLCRKLSENIIMAFCYRFKLRIPQVSKCGQKLMNFKLVVPFKSRRFSGGKFGYSTLEEDTKFIAKALKFLKHRSYQTL